jgi:hypothetical protein
LAWFLGVMTPNCISIHRAQLINEINTSLPSFYYSVITAIPSKTDSVAATTLPISQIFYAGLATQDQLHERHQKERNSSRQNMFSPTHRTFKYPRYVITDSQ